MSPVTKIGIVVALAVAVVAVLVLKPRGGDGGAPEVAGSTSQASRPASAPAPLPKLIELGSSTCIPCKAMKPILAELARQYAGRFDVETVDVHRNPAAAEAYHVRIIPTQVFLDAAGNELFRHEGFFPKEDILAKWRELGVE